MKKLPRPKTESTSSSKQKPTIKIKKEAKNIPSREIRRSSRAQTIKSKEPPVYYTEEEYQKEQKEIKREKIDHNDDDDNNLPKDKKQIELELKQQKASYYLKPYRPECLNNLNFVITGALSVTRDLAKNVIHKYGGYVQSKVDKYTNYVVMGERVGNNKTSKAKELKIPAISEDQLFKLLRGGKDVTLTDPDSIPKKKYTPSKRIIRKKTITRKPRALKKENTEEGNNLYFNPDEAENIVQASILSGFVMEEELSYIKPEQFI